mgnify:CR=1 FL=1
MPNPPADLSAALATLQRRWGSAAPRRGAEGDAPARARTAGGNPQGQMLGVVFMTVMAIEMALGFALVTNVYRVRRADITEKLRRLRG